MTAKQTTSDRLTKVNYLGDVKTTYFSGKRDTIGFKGDKGLYFRFKPISKEMYGSTCRAFECFMSATVAAYENKVNFSLSSNPLRIDQHVLIERNIRPRRKKVVDVDPVMCFVGECMSVASCIMEEPVSEKQYHFCKKHSAVPRRKGWKEVKE